MRKIKFYAYGISASEDGLSQNAGAGFNINGSGFTETTFKGGLYFSRNANGIVDYGHTASLEFNGTFRESRLGIGWGTSFVTNKLSVNPIFDLPSIKIYNKNGDPWSAKNAYKNFNTGEDIDYIYLNFGFGSLTYDSSRGDYYGYNAMLNF